jgi:competence protein ComEA
MDLSDFQKKAILLIFISILAGSILLARKEPLKTKNNSETIEKIPQQKTKPIAPVTASKIDINTADYNTLLNLPGIGPVLAQEIINYREKNGQFKYIEDIDNIPGIGEKKLARIRDFIDLPGKPDISGISKTATSTSKSEGSHKPTQDSPAREAFVQTKTIYDSRIDPSVKCPYCGKQMWEKGRRKTAYIRCPHCLKLLS